MSEGTKIFKRVEEEQSALERILRYIPGYRGYKQKEIRRETDRIIRSKVAGYVERGRKRLDSAVRTTAERRVDERSKRIDRSVKTLMKFAEKVRHAPHGYAGLFDAIKVREEELDRLVSFDASLTELAQKMDEASQAILQAARRRRLEELDSSLDQMDSLTQEMEEILSRREETLLGTGGK